MKKVLISWGIFLLMGAIIFYPVYYFKIPILVVFVMGLILKLVADIITDKIYKNN